MRDIIEKLYRSTSGVAGVSSYPPQYIAGLKFFNEEDFFECHEAWEEVWAELSGDNKRFMQGMIQASVALFHFGNENYGGAKKLYHAAMEKLVPLADSTPWGIDLAALVEAMRVCFQELLENSEAYPTTVSLRDELVPKIVIVDQELLVDE